jgi:hypothetical protein
VDTAPHSKVVEKLLNLSRMDHAECEGIYLKKLESYEEQGYIIKETELGNQSKVVYSLGPLPDEVNYRSLLSDYVETTKERKFTEPIFPDADDRIQDVIDRLTR